jgi:hypothetical protein
MKCDPTVRLREGLVTRVPGGSGARMAEEWVGGLRDKPTHRNVRAGCGTCLFAAEAGGSFEMDVDACHSKSKIDKSIGDPKLVRDL